MRENPCCFLNDNNKGFLMTIIYIKTDFPRTRPKPANDNSVTVLSLAGCGLYGACLAGNY